MRIPTIEESRKAMAGPDINLDTAHTTAKEVNATLSERMSELARYRQALETIKETSYDSEAVEVAERALG